jgi:hypothetical protein
MDPLIQLNNPKQYQLITQIYCNFFSLNESISYRLHVSAMKKENRKIDSYRSLLSFYDGINFQWLTNQFQLSIKIDNHEPDISIEKKYITRAPETRS